MRKRILWLFLSFLPFLSEAQQVPVYSQFFMNPYLYNPAFAGIEGHTVVFFMHRQQWVGIEGAPQYSHVVFHTPLKNRLAIGGEISTDRQGPLTDNSFRVTGGYLLPLDRKHYLRFGLSLGAGNNGVDLDAIGNSADPALVNLLDNNFYMRSDFGVTYHFGKFNAGFSLPSLISHDVLSQKTLSPVRVTPVDNILFKANYRQSLFDDALAWEPHILYKYSGVGNSQYEVTNIFHIKHLVWVGASYRQDAGFVGLAGIKIAERLAVGYAYDLPSSDLATFSTGSHEIHLGLHLGTRKEHAEHVSSFIKSHSKSKAERDEEAARQLALEEARKKREEERLQALNNTKPEEKKSALLADDTPEKPVEETKPAGASAWQYVSENNGAPISRTNAAGQAEEGVTLTRTNAQGNKEFIVSFIPEAKFGSEEVWSLVNNAGAAQERVNANGQKEVGVLWRVKHEDGSIEDKIIWSPVYTSEAEMKTGMAASGVDMTASQNPDAAHNFALSSSRSTMPERTVNGERQVGFVFNNTLADGTVEETIVWVPAPDPNTGERWELADPNEKPAIRIGPNGEKELGVILKQIHPDGTEDLMVEYEPVVKKEAPKPASNVAAAPKATNWAYVSENEGAPIERELNGTKQEGVTLSRKNAQGNTEYTVSFIPVADFNSEERWSLVNSIDNVEERTAPNGQKEVGLQWRVSGPGLPSKVSTVWSPAYSSEALLKEDLRKQGVKIGVQGRKEETDPNNNFKLVSDTGARPTRTIKGEDQVGFLFRNSLPNGDVEESTIWVPAPDKANGEQWQIAEDGEKPLVRVGSSGQKEMGFTVKKIHADGSQELLVQYEPVTRVNAAPRIVENTETVPAPTPTTPTPRSGRNLLEMAPGNYVIVGAFASFDNAQNYSDTLLDEGYFTQVGYHSPKNLYYVQIYSSQSLPQAEKERDRLRKSPTLSKTWVFTVK
ncbi:PorP/SprF family type IX secretion system membrane protein [uncultured Imperialibacter sp.]|uniref:PorP/SprF family type IX secretion system membrane protein n=1 Tax=uncultured Imperialibacter sp. TaxID=1672639 RepID=UPI0030D94A7B|tara:strand:+ start:15337 stop:18183 length:2847 start_codon:yes stop_codon:yes gene_type:complete